MTGIEAVEDLRAELREGIARDQARLEGVELAIAVLGGMGRAPIARSLAAADAPLALPAPTRRARQPRAVAAKRVGGGRPKTPERDATIVRLFKDGIKTDAIAAKVGLTYAGVIYVLKKRGAWAVAEQKRAASKARAAAPHASAEAPLGAIPSAAAKERIVKLHKVGRFDTEIAREVGLPVSEVRAALVEAGLRAAA